MMNKIGLNSGPLCAAASTDRKRHDDFAGSEHAVWLELYLGVHRCGNGHARVTISRSLFTRRNDDGTFDPVTKLLGLNDRELVGLRPFVSGDWQPGFRSFPLRRFERDLHTPEEACELLRDQAG